MKKYIYIFVLIGCIQCGSVSALEVVDHTNLAQNLISAREAILQTQQQIELLRTQILAYKRMLMDALNPGIWIWGDIQKTIDQLKSTLNSLKDFASISGNLDEMLSQFGSYDKYTSGSGYGGAPCAASQELVAGDYLGSKLQKETADDLLKLIEEQEKHMEEFQEQFEQLKDNAASAEGQQQAIQSCNQFLSLQSEQLTQIHALLMAQNNMLGVITQNKTNQEARDRMGSALQFGDADIFQREREGSGKAFGFTGN